jgi:hypothetical protein
MDEQPSVKSVLTLNPTTRIANDTACSDFQANGAGKKFAHFDETGVYGIC